MFKNSVFSGLDAGDRGNEVFCNCYTVLRFAAIIKAWKDILIGVRSVSYLTLKHVEEDGCSKIEFKIVSYKSLRGVKLRVFRFLSQLWVYSGDK